MNTRERLVTAAVPVGDLLVRSAARHTHETALVFPDARMTYEDLAEASMTVARALAGLGVRPGEHVGVLIPNSADFVKAFFGISMMGAVVVPINTRYRVSELRHLVDHADLVALVTTDAVKDYVDFASLLREAFPDIARRPGAAASLEVGGAPALRFCVNVGKGVESGLVNLEEFTAAAARVTEWQIERWRWGVRLGRMATLLYTSGTTARSKGCMLTHEALSRKANLVGRRFGVSARDRCWVPLPLFHGVALGALLFTIEAGATFVSSSHFDADAALELIARERATLLYPGFPAVTLGLIDAGLERLDPSEIRAVVSAGPRELWERLREILPAAAQVSGYGLSEAAGIVSYGSVEDPWETRVATAGSVIPGYEVRIVDVRTRAPLGPDERGEILVRGFGVFDGYYKDPDATAAMLDHEGFLHTGDIGYVDGRGHVVFDAREKDMLKVGGENVAPAEIETYLLTHPLIVQAQVVGLPDDRMGEIPAAFVEVRSEAQLAEQDVIDYCRGRIASFKVPCLVRFVRDWPMSDTSLKIQKHELRQRLVQELATRRESGESGGLRERGSG